VHRARYAQEVDNYDLFVYLEDDILVSASQMRSFIYHSKMLRASGLHDYEIGFFRQEVDIASPNLGMVVWEETKVRVGMFYGCTWMSRASLPSNGLRRRADLLTCLLIPAHVAREVFSSVD